MRNLDAFYGLSCIVSVSSFTSLFVLVFDHLRTPLNLRVTFPIGSFLVGDAE